MIHYIENNATKIINHAPTHVNLVIFLPSEQFKLEAHASTTH